jgi:hypothetical protein
VTLAGSLGLLIAALLALGGPASAHSLGTGAIVVKVVTSPGGSSQQFTVHIDGFSASLTDGGTFGAAADSSTSHSVSEDPVLGWKSDGGSCDNGDSPTSVNVGDGETVTCTFTNTQAAAVTLHKTIVSSNPDSGTFDLKADATVVKAAAADGDSGSATIDPGTHTITETAASGSLSDYVSAISCTKNGLPYTSGAGTSLQATVAVGDSLDCTLTNSRKPTITLVKSLVPNADPGRFNLKVGGAIIAGSVGNGGGGTFETVPGTYILSEAAAIGTLSNYASIYSCTRNGNPDTAGAGTSLPVTLQYGDNYFCVFGNTRKPSVTIHKTVVPANDNGRFDLNLDSTVVAKSVPNGGVGTILTSPGNHTVNETGDVANLAEYTSVWTCTLNGVKSSGNSTSIPPFTFNPGDKLDCTFTNTRKTAKVTVIKKLVPATDTGRFNLKVDSAIVASAVGNNGTGSANVYPGSHTVSEAPTATTTGVYTTAISCTKNGNPLGTSATTSITFTTAVNDVIVCTITNTRH